MRELIPAERRLAELWPDVSDEISIETIPVGADVYMKEYSAVDSEWEYLGKSPIEQATVPRGLKRWRVERAGFADLEGAFRPAVGTVSLSLSEEGSIPADMVRVPGGGAPFWITTINFEGNLQLDDFLIDKYEVTHRQFQDFVDSGGYRDQKYWKHRFYRDGRELTWEQAMAGFQDKTGRRGPATWELGNYPEGRGDYPVTGVSWYEAAAYAEFVGKSLPTIYHWGRAASAPPSEILPLSNFGSDGPAPVGEFAGMTQRGVNDMAGNVKEWCWNESSENQRYALGGAWSDPIYMFQFPHVQSLWDRSATNGFRCVRYLGGEGQPEKAFQQVRKAVRDYTKEKPVADDVYEIYKNRFSYDPIELDAIIEKTDDQAPQWTKQKVTFNAAYPNERVIAYLYLPKNVAPPYQAVVYYTGSGAIARGSSEKPGNPPIGRIDFLVKSGRALVFPIYRGTFERNEGLKSTWPDKSYTYVDYATKWIKDFKRTIDYQRVATISTWRG